MAEFTISARNYRTGKMDAFTQFHVSRRLAPLFSELKEASSKGNTDLGNGIEAMAKAVSAMSDADSEYILNACLNVTQRQVGEAWTPVRVSGRLMYDDIDLAVLMQIAGRTLFENLSPFFSGLPNQVS